MIGCGKWGRIHANGAPGNSRIGVCRCSAMPVPSAPPLSRPSMESCLLDLSSMLSQARIEAATIATPHPLHADPAIRCAEAGVHVLVESRWLLRSRLRRHARRREARKNRPRSHQPRRLFEPVQAYESCNRRGQNRPPGLGVFQMYSWRDEAYYRSDPWRGKWSTEEACAGQSVTSSA